MSWVQLDEKQQEEKKTELYEKEEPNVSCMKMNKKPGLLLQVSRLRLGLSLETILKKGFELW
jgi:hypothetical protein